MLDATAADPERQFSFTDQDIDRWKKVADVQKDDVARIVALKDVIEPRIEQYTDAFFDYLAKIGAAVDLFAKRSVFDLAKRRKQEHLRALVLGSYEREYIEQRIKLATLYSEYELETREFLAAYEHLMLCIGKDIVDKLRADLPSAFKSYEAVVKVGSFDRAIISDVMIAERERIINLQQQAIRELSTPILQVRDRLLILPIIGMLDSDRANQLTKDLLGAIRASRCRIVVMDITGVAAVNSKVANHLIQTVTAARLMGSAVIVTGLSAEVAQALVGLGIDLGGIETTSDLQSGLERAERTLGYRLVRDENAAA